jgi:hypothetical protein
MTLPSSGTLSLNDIATEFSDTQPNSMNEFYKDGSLVPSQKIIPASGSDITPFSGTNAPKFQGGTLPNNTQVYEGNNTSRPNYDIGGAGRNNQSGSGASSTTPGDVTATYTVPYTGTLYALVVGGGASGSWWGGGISGAGGGGAAGVASYSVTSGDSVYVRVGTGGHGHDTTPNGFGERGARSLVYIGSDYVFAGGAGAVDPYSSSSGGGNFSSSGWTIITSANGSNGTDVSGGGASGLESLTNFTLSTLSGTTYSRRWRWAEENAPINNGTNTWRQGSFSTSTGVFTFSSPDHQGAWGWGGDGISGDGNGGGGASGLVILWMNPQQYQTINTNVPTSGEISIADFYDAEDA